MTKTLSFKFLKNLASVAVALVPIMAILTVQRYRAFGFPGMFNMVDRKRVKTYGERAQS